MSKQSIIVVALTGAVLGLLGCSGGADQSLPTVGLSDEAAAEATAENSVEGAETEGTAADSSSLEAVLEVSSQQDFLRDFFLEGTQLTSRFLVIRGISADGGDIAVEITVDPSGLDNFTLAPAEALYEVNPFDDLQAIAMNFPGFDYVSGAEVSTFSGTNGPTSVIFSVDSEGLLRNVEYTSPEYSYVEAFSYGSEFEDTVPREFVERVNADREEGGLDYVFGFTQDGFQSWEVETF